MKKINNNFKKRFLTLLPLTLLPITLVSCSINPTLKQVVKDTLKETLKDDGGKRHNTSKNSLNNNSSQSRENASPNTKSIATSTTLSNRRDVIPQNGETIFVRPPFISNFIIKNTNLKISTIFNHLDSPGLTERKSKENSKKILYKEKEVNSSLITTKGLSFSGQGSQEVSEYLGLSDVFNYVKNSSFHPNLAIYGGDTNIKNQNYFLTQELIKLNPDINSTLVPTTQISSQFKNNEQFLTSLGTKGNYSNQYDKMLYWTNNSNLHVDQINNYDHQFKIDLYKVFTPWLLSDSEVNQIYKKSKEQQATFIRKKLSDHAPVYTDVVVNTQPQIKFNEVISNSDYSKPSTNTLRIAHWNILNYGKDITKAATPEFLVKAKMIATVIKNGGFDIIGLTEINNGQGDSVKLVLDDLRKLNPDANYQLVIQRPTDTNIPTSLLKSNRFGASQQEQVAVIYDANKVELNGDYTYTKAIKFYGVE